MEHVASLLRLTTIFLVVVLQVSNHQAWAVGNKEKREGGMSSNKAARGNDDDNNNGSNDDDSNQCGLYLAISSTSTVDEPKWGLFSGKDINAKRSIGYGEVAIHLFNLMGNQIWTDPETQERMDDLERNPYANLVDWMEQFLWVPHSSGGQFELEGPGMRIVTAIGGGGAIASYNPKMTNADWNHSSAFHREAWNEYPEVSHPGRGAYSNYYNVELYSTEVIPAGKEIFLNYGDIWANEEQKQVENLTKKDYAKLDETIERMIAFFEKHKDHLDEGTKKEIYAFLLTDIMSAAAGTKKGKQIQQMLPDNPDELKTVLEKGGSFYISSPMSIRTIDWLEENGRCVDNIRPGPSTIPYAGRGAFATRPIKQGSLVAPVPLLQIPHEDILDMYDVRPVEVPPKDGSEDPEYTMIRDNDKFRGSQLLYNYIYGHPQSHLVFFPLGSGTNYINHSKEKVNAKLVWSDHPNHHKDWFDVDPEYLFDEDHSYLGLMMEIVATKDIEEGDEIFLDYGDAWQAAWDEHLVEFDEAKPEKWPIRALDLNQEHKKKSFRTKDEEPYPDNVMIKCFLMVKKPEDGQPAIDDQGRKIRIWSKADSGKPNIVSDNLFDCEIEKATESPEGKYYDVTWSNGVDYTIVKKVPHKALVFVDKPGTGDQHFYGFRRYIGIPDEIFPEGPWRNAYSPRDGDDDDDDEDQNESEE